jgi:hypothetical protein
MSVPAPVFIYTPIEVPEFANIEDAEAFLLKLSQREGIQELESQAVAAISTRVRDWIQSKRQGQELEIKKINAGHETGEQIIKIEGGLPTLPGTNITMPHQLNGHSADGLLTNEAAQPRTIEHNPSSPRIESAPTNANDHGEQT